MSTSKPPAAKTAKKRRKANGAMTSPQTAAAKMKAAKALELRMEGKSFDEIAQEVGYAGRQGAFDAVRRSLAEVTREPAEELLRLDLERLDKMWQIHYLQAQSGDVQALAGCLKIMERRAKMLGIDAPAKTEVTGRDGGPIATKTERELTDAELAAELARHGIQS